MTEPAFAMGAFLATIGLILGLTVPRYLRFFRIMARDHPETWERLGRPNLLSRSPLQSLRVQHFVYRGYKRVDASDELTRLCRQLALWTPILLALLFAEFGWFLLATLDVVSG